MRSLSAPALVPSTQITGSSASRSEANFQRCLFGRIAPLVWDKPDMAVADIAGVSDRAARDYLNGKVALPSIVLAALVQEIVKRR